jgi:DNA polymerase II small subunit/DNA polymerase delta subunit B
MFHNGCYRTKNYSIPFIWSALSAKISEGTFSENIMLASSVLINSKEHMLKFFREMINFYQQTSFYNNVATFIKLS